MRRGALVLLLVAGAARAGDEELPLITYVVTEPTSCDRLAAKLWGDRDKFTLIHAHNELGPLPHHLAPGTRLVIPAFGPLAPDAKVTRAEGRVDARSPRQSEWSPASVGTRLFRAWRVFSRAQSSAEVTYRDTSQILLRENTVVVIYGPSAGAAQFAEAELEDGALRTRLAELAGRAPLVVRTEAAETELAGGQAVLAALAGGRTAVSNHEGPPVKVRGRRAARPAPAVAVDAGMGTDVARGQDPAPPRPLPAAPEWADGPAVFVALDGRAGDAAASWRPVAGAAGYHVELARDPAGDDVVGQVTVGAEITAYLGRGLPVGVYHLGVSALDAAGLEGRPSARRRLVVAAAALTPGAAGPTPGAIIAAPAGQRCSLDGAEPRERVLLRAAGRVELRCGGDVTVVDVAPLGLSLARAPSREPAVILDGPPLLVAAVELRAPPGVTLTRRRDNSVALALTRDAPAIIPITAVLTVDGEPLTVAAIEVERPRTPPPALEAGVFFRAAAYHGLELGENGVPELALLGGVRVTQGLDAHFALEAELAAGTLRFPDGLSAPSTAYAARLLARLTTTRIRPLLGAGMTVQEVFRATDIVPAFRYGPHLLGGIELSFAPLCLRLDVQPWFVESNAATWFSAALALRI